MFRVLAIIIFLLGTRSTSAQEVNVKDSLSFALKEALAHYGNLDPHTDSIFYLSDINYTEERALAEGLHFEEAGEIDVFSVIWHSEQKIFTYIEALLAMCSLEEMMALPLSNISMVLSEDKRFFNFSIDEKAGGTYRGRDSKSYYCSEEVVLYDVSGISRDGIANIYDIHTATGVKYLLMESTRSCSTCDINKAHLLHFTEGKPVTDFAYEMQNRSGSLEIYYNEESQLLKIDYETDDIQSYCDCEQSSVWSDREYIEIENQDTEQCNCVFKFNGETFEIDKE